MENISKAQRRKLKKEQKKQEKERKKALRRKKQTTKKIRSYGIAILIILAIAGFFYFKSVPPKDAPLMKLPNSWSFGRVSQSKGVVSTLLTMKNVGKSDLIINDMMSSCSCTSALLIVDGIEGPRFGMHNNPTNWSATLKQGETAQLKVSYDPNVHKDLRGLVTRTITVFSNDPRSPHKITIHANQVP